MEQVAAASAPVRPAAVRCLACSGSTSEFWAHGWDAEYYTSERQFTYHRCPICEALSIDPVPHQELYAIYPANYYSYGAKKQSLVHRVKGWLDGRLFARILRTIPGEELHVLDVGGGSGVQLDQVKRLDPRISLTKVVDLDERAKTLAESRGHEFFCGPIERFETRDRFDLILLLNLIEHVQNPAEILARLGSVLSDDGRLIVKTPNYSSLDASLFKARNWAGYHCPRHWVLFNRKSFDRLVRSAGFRIESFSYTQGAPFWVKSILFALAERGLIRADREHPIPSHFLNAPLNALFAGLDFVRGRFVPTSQMIYVLRRN